jgi:hypothetical protein
MTPKQYGIVVKNNGKKKRKNKLMDQDFLKRQFLTSKLRLYLFRYLVYTKINRQYVQDA